MLFSNEEKEEENKWLFKIVEIEGGSLQYSKLNKSPRRTWQNNSIELHVNITIPDIKGFRTTDSNAWCSHDQPNKGIVLIIIMDPLYAI